MDFQSVNPLNVRLNVLSGNLLPLTPNGFPLSLKIYSAIVWMLEIILIISLMYGCANIPLEKFVKDSMVGIAMLIEMFFLIVRIHSRNDLVYQMIRKLNDMLNDDDDDDDGIMQNVVATTLSPIMTLLNFYFLAGTASVVAWYSTSFLLAFEKDLFYYEDYKEPLALSKQPFSRRIYLSGSLFLTIIGTLLFLRKIGIDVYMMHLILMVTAQYRYVSLKIAMIFRDGESWNGFDRSSEKYHSGIETKFRTLCQHYNAVISLSSMLKKLMALNCSLIYVDSIFRFCITAIMLAKVMSPISLESFMVLGFAGTSVMQFYMLCSCIQQLLDASKEMTNKAFNEKWYAYGSSVKSTFMLMILGNNLECKLSACDMFALSLSSFVTILNQAYSIALLFLRLN